MKKIIEEIENDYQLLKSLSVREDGGTIILQGARYYGDKACPTGSQIAYLIGLDNVDYQSNNNIRKTNKWVIKACIDIAKKYPNNKFYVRTIK